jgi:hypothetical protein
MQQLLANYLFKYKSCALPQMGTLSIQNVQSSTIFGEHLYAAPIPTISFTSNETSSDGFEKFIAHQKNISIPEAKDLLAIYVQKLSKISSSEKSNIKDVGEFYKNENDEWCFIPAEVNAHFFPKTIAERVIHPNATHTMLVGDTETNTTTMTEYFAEEAPIVKNKWWIAASVIAVLSAAAIGYFFSESKSSSFIGNANKVEMGIADSTYHILP